MHRQYRLSHSHPYSRMHRPYSLRRSRMCRLRSRLYNLKPLCSRSLPESPCPRSLYPNSLRLKPTNV